MELKEKYEGYTAKPEQTRRSAAEVVGLDTELQRSKALSDELAALDKPQERSYAEIERLVHVWKEQKKVQGVEDSDTEKRTQVLLHSLTSVVVRGVGFLRLQEETVHLGHGDVQEEVARHEGRFHFECGEDQRVGRPHHQQR